MRDLSSCSVGMNAATGYSLIELLWNFIVLDE